MAQVPRVSVVGGPSKKVQPRAKIANRAPGSGDKNYPIGQTWIDVVLLDAYTLGGFVSGTPQWLNTAGGGGSYSSLTVTPGPTAITGLFTVTSGLLNVSIGADAADHDIALGSATGVSALTVQSGTSGRTETSTGVISMITSLAATAEAVVIEASGAASGLALKAGSAGIAIGNEADTAVLDLGNIAPTASRTTTIGGGTVVTAAVTDTIDIGPDGATTNADSIKVVNIATGVLTTGENNVNINTGTAASGSQTTNIATGTGGAATKIVNIGNTDGLTSLVFNGTTLLNDSVNVNTGINTGTSTGTVDIGNSAAGALVMGSAAGLAIDIATASHFTVAGAGDLTLSAGTQSVIVSGAEAVVDAVQLTATNAAGGVQVTTGALAATTGLHIVQGAATAAVQVGAGAPSHAAPKGTLYLNTTGSSTSTRAYINTDASTTWTNITTAA